MGAADRGASAAVLWLYMAVAAWMFHAKHTLFACKAWISDVSRETTGLRGVLARGGGAKAARGRRCRRSGGRAEASDGARRFAEASRGSPWVLKICKNVPRETKMSPKTRKNMNRIKIFAITEGNY